MECICCNKEVKNEKYFVHLLTNGNIIDTDEYQGNDDQGFYNVGSECKKRIPKEYDIKNIIMNFMNKVK